jgi:hypothetical protein
MKKAFFFDIDGTLVHEQNGKLVVPNKNIQAINKLRNKGYKTFIATGRTEAFIPSSVYELEMDGYVTANGAVVRVNDKLIHQQKLCQEVVVKIIKFCEKYNHPWMFEGDLAYVNDLEAPELIHFYQSVIVNKDKIVEAKNIESTITYNALIMGDKIDLKELQKVIGSNYVIAEHFSHGYVDCYFKDNTKADGIDKVISNLGLEDYETYAFGDGNNDLEMFDYVDVAIAMENATDRLKAKANFITKSNYESGIYYSLINLGLI